MTEKEATEARFPFLCCLCSNIQPHWLEFIYQGEKIPKILKTREQKYRFEQKSGVRNG